MSAANYSACMQTPGKSKTETVLDLDEKKALLNVPYSAPPPAPPAAARAPGLVENTAPLDARVLFGEFLSTFLFVYLSVTSAAPAAPGAPPPALSNGAVIAAIACSFMPVSGAHLNPAVTAALWVTRRVSTRRALAFVPVQLGAAALASTCVRALGVPVVFGLPAQLSGAQFAKAFFDELFPMALIVFVVFQTAVATKQEGGVGNQLAALYIGLAVVACAGVFGSGVFNPARAFGPALVAGNFVAHVPVYWGGPLVGALLAALISEHVFLAPASGRKPNSWLYVLGKQMEGMRAKVRALGVAGLIAYGILNLVVYSVGMGVLLLNGGTFTTAAVAKAWFVTWGFSNATKPIRLAITVAMAPYIKRRLDAWSASRR